MRISIDCRYIRHRPSGIGHYVRALIDRLPALAPADTFHLWVGPRASRPLTPFANVDEELVPAPPNSLRTLLCHGRLSDLKGADIFHAPFNLMGRGIPCPTVVTIHDLIWLLTPTASEGWLLLTPYRVAFYRWGILHALRHAARIVAVSEATADAIRRFFPNAFPRVRVIRHGVETRFRPARDPEKARSRAGRLIGDGHPYFLVVGQNAPFKNHRMILDAFGAAGLGSPVNLVFVERLYTRGSLARRARRLGVQGRVFWLKGVEEDDLVALLQSALALIQFSLFEGFGMPALEAMACGTPVIASDIPPLVEVLGGAGVNLPLDIAPLASAIRRIATEGSWRRELSERGLERARSFSWDRSAALHLEVYREAAAEGPFCHTLTKGNRQAT